MANLDVLQCLLQHLAQAFGDVHRAMMTAGAADGDGDIGPVAGGEPWQPLEQVRRNVLEHLLDVRLRGQVVDDRLLQPRMIPQLDLRSFRPVCK